VTSTDTNRKVALLFTMDSNAPKLAKVEKVLGRTGSRGGVIQVRVQFTHEVSPDLVCTIAIHQLHHEDQYRKPDHGSSEGIRN